MLLINIISSFDLVMRSFMIIFRLLFLLLLISLWGLFKATRMIKREYLLIPKSKMTEMKFAFLLLVTVQYSQIAFTTRIKTCLIAKLIKWFLIINMRIFNNSSYDCRKDAFIPRIKYQDVFVCLYVFTKGPS